MATTAAKVEAALRKVGRRSRVDAIDDNPATPGEVVLWVDGIGRPVYSTREAIRLVNGLYEEQCLREELGRWTEEWTKER